MSTPSFEYSRLVSGWVLDNNPPGSPQMSTFTVTTTLPNGETNSFTRSGSEDLALKVLNEMGNGGWMLVLTVGSDPSKEYLEVILRREISVNPSNG